MTNENQQPQTRPTEYGDQPEQGRQRSHETGNPTESDGDRDGNGGESADASPSVATDDSSLPMRRRSLLSSLAGASLAGAAGVAMDGAITPASAEDGDDGGGVSENGEITVGFEVEIKNPRIVQSVTNTRVAEIIRAGPGEKWENVRKEWPDPALVANKPGSVAFRLKPVGIDAEDIPPVEEFPSEIACRIGAIGVEENHEFTLTAAETRKMLTEGKDLPKVLGDGGEKLPAFPVNRDLREVKIVLAPEAEVIQADPVTIGGDDGPAMSEIKNVPPLRIGFIGVRSRDSDIPNFDFDDIDEIKRVANRSVEYIKKAFPVSDVKAAVYHEPIVSAYRKGESDADDESDDSTKMIDTENASSELSTAVQGGIGPGSSDATLISGEAPMEHLHATVLLGGSDYANIISDGMERSGQYVAENHVSIANVDYSKPKPHLTVAHEIGHHFVGKAYGGTPLAMQLPGESTGETATHASARKGRWVKLDKYEYAPSEDVFTVTDGANSLMSWAEELLWPDSLMYDETIKTLRAREPGSEESSDESGESDKKPWWDPRRYFMGTATLDENGTVQVRGTLGDSASESPDTEGVPDEKTVQVDVIGKNGEEKLASRTVPTEHTVVAARGDGADERHAGPETVSGVAPFTIPFPEEATEVQITYQGTTTTVQPRALHFETVAKQLPSAAFEDQATLAALSTADGQADREALVSAAQRMGEALNADAYSAAAEILDSEIEPVVANLDPDYPDAANLPDHDELQEMVDVTSERVQTFADELGDGETTAGDVDGAGGGGGGSISTERTSLHDQDGGAC